MKNSKLLIVLLSVLLVCAGCSQDKLIKDADNFTYKTVTIEGHEYIKYLTAYGSENVTHKGNCKAH